MNASNVPTLKTSQMMTIAYFAAILIALYVVYKILASVGLIKTRKKKLAEKAQTTAETELRTLEYFNPLLLKVKPAGYVPLGSSTGGMYAVLLRQAMAGLGTNEEKLFGVFGKLKNKYNISEVAAYYLVKFNRDLQSDILNELTDKEQVTLFEMINKLPKL